MLINSNPAALSHFIIASSLDYCARSSYNVEGELRQESLTAPSAKL
jgi:hypothetical protein